MTKPITFSMLAGISLLLTVLIAHAADNGIDVRVRNNLESPVNVFLKTGNGETSYGTIPIGGSRVQGSRPGDVWVFKSGSVNDSYSATDASDQRYEVGVRDTITRNFLNDTDQPLTVYEGGEELATIRGEGTVTLDLMPGTDLRFVHPDDLAAEFTAIAEGESYLTVGTDEDAEIVLAAVSNNASRSTENLTHPDDMPESNNRNSATAPKRGNDDPTKTLAERIRHLNRLDQPEPKAETLMDPQPEDEVTASTKGCSTKWYEAATGYNELIVLDSKASRFFPGALIKGETVLTGRNAPISQFPRRPMTVSISLNGPIGVELHRTVQNPSALSQVRVAINDILGQEIDEVTPANQTFEITEIESSHDIHVAIGGAFENSYAEIEGSFDFTSSSIKSRVLVKFIQNYYTIDVDEPGLADSFFINPESIHADDLGDAPLYVNSVTYGRQIYFTVTSEESNTNIEATLNATFDAMGSSGSLDASAEYAKSMKNYKMSATIIGGSGAEAAVVIDSPEELMELIKSGGNYSKNSPGLPIAYTLSYLSNLELARIVVASKYSIESCGASYEIALKDMNLRINGEAGSWWEQFYGKINVSQIGPDGNMIANSEKAIWDRKDTNFDLYYQKVTAVPDTTPVVFKFEDSRNGRIRITLQDFYEDDDTTDDTVTAPPKDVYLADIPSSGESKLITVTATDGGSALDIRFEIKRLPN